MDTNTYEYQSYILIRRRMKDRGAFCARLRREDGGGKLQIAVTTRRKYRLQRFFACVASGPFVLPAPCAEQNNGQNSGGGLP